MSWAIFPVAGKEANGRWENWWCFDVLANMEANHSNHVTCRQMGDLVAGVVMRR